MPARRSSRRSSRRRIKKTVIIRPKITSTPAEAVEFIHKLSIDDAFRRNFEASPRKIFAKYNINIPESQLPKKLKLPSKAVLQKTIMDISITQIFQPTLAVSPFLAFLSFFAFFKK